MNEAAHIVWGPELSPFLLKLESLLAQAGVPFRRLPRDGSRLENLRTSLLVDRAKKKGQVTKPGGLDELDEFPLVPFLVTPSREVLYDSTALAAWLDQKHPGEAGPLVPATGAAGFVARFLDEAFDEFGLYLVHHNRWKLAAGDNDYPGRRLAREYSKLLPPGIGSFFASWFERRQVRRLPYLFSVAPAGYRVDGLAPEMTPPSREGFPPTHELLEETWEKSLAAIETILGLQPFLLGGRFTVADASAYGQLSMNLTDALAARRLKELAPHTFDWLAGIRDRRHTAARGELRLSPLLGPLLDVFLDTFVPLMRANEAAFVAARDAGATMFNEKAFDAGQRLFDCELRGRPCRSVVKSFQVPVWRGLCRAWAELDRDARERVRELVPATNLDASFATPKKSA